MTSEGHAYARFRRALDSGNPTVALAAATELEHVGIVDALHPVLWLAQDGDERRFCRAAVRWQARYYQQIRSVDAAEATAVLGLLLMLAGERREQACRALAEVFDRQELLPAGELSRSPSRSRPASTLSG